MSFWEELRRRNVFKVGVAYAIVAWLMVQIAATCFPTLQLPEWSVTLVTVFLIIGFPIALLLAWAYEVTPEGIKRTKEVPLAENIRQLTGQKLMYVVVALLVVAVAFLAAEVYLGDRDAIESEFVTTEPEQAPVVKDVEEAAKTIAVIPFVNLSPDPDQEYFVDGLSEELLNCLSKIADLRVTSRTSSFAFKGTNKKVQEIAAELGVDHILEGSVRKADNALRITAQLIRARDDYHLWSETYNRELEDIFEVQEDIATAVAEELKVTLGIGKSFKQLGGTDNPVAYELYLIAKGIQIGNPFSADMNHALESIDNAIALDPEFALAWATKANLQSILLDLDAGLNAAEKAIELEPNLAEAYAALGGNRMMRGDYIAAELAFRKALELTTEPISGSPYFSHLLEVGHFERAHEILKAQLRVDSLSQNAWNFYIQSSCFLGDMGQIEEENRRAKALFGDQWDDSYWTMWGHLGAGDVLSSDDIVYIDPINDAAFIVAKEQLESPEEALKELRQLYTDDTISGDSLMNISLWAAYFGDPEFAMDAMDKACSIGTSTRIYLYLPQMHEVRQLPRFKELMKEIGLVDYWNEFGWPDICRPLENGDFECE